jgi:hypothetical protein
MNAKNKFHSNLPVPSQKDWRDDVFLLQYKTRPAEILAPLGHAPRFSTIEKYLPTRSLLMLKGDHSGEKLTSIDGIVWITQSGDPDDIVLCPGETFEITRKSPIIIQSMADTRLMITGAYQPSAFGRAVQQITGVLSHFL